MNNDLPTTPSEQARQCPICGNSVATYDERFTNTVCKECEQRAIDGNGDRVTFYNEDMGGGLITVHNHADGTTTTDGNFDCTIDGKPCKGVEFHMGGTGIELLV